MTFAKTAWNKFRTRDGVPRAEFSTVHVIMFPASFGPTLFLDRKKLARGTRCCFGGFCCKNDPFLDLPEMKTWNIRTAWWEDLDTFGVHQVIFAEVYSDFGKDRENPLNLLKFMNKPARGTPCLFEIFCYKNGLSPKCPNWILETWWNTRRGVLDKSLSPTSLRPA